MIMRILDHLEEWLIGLLIAAATLIIFVAVVHRYASTVPFLFDLTMKIHLSWAQELCIYMFIWMAKFGAAYGVRTGIHVGVDVLLNKLERPMHNRIVLFGLGCGALFTGIVGSLGTAFVYGLAQTDQVSPDLEIPSWIAYLAIPLGSYLMCFRFLQVAVTFARTGELPKHDHSHVEGVETPAEAAR